MKKQQLLKLEMLKVTDEMYEIAQNDVPQKNTWGDRDVYQYGTYFRLQKEENILKVAIFFADQIRVGKKLPAYILFINKEADDFITFEVDKNRWRNSMLCNLDWPNYYYQSGKYISQEDIDILEKELEKEFGDYRDIQLYQRGVRRRNLIRRDKKITDTWDKMMEQVPELPKDWKHWVARNGISQHIMFYEYKKGGAHEGYCSHCRRMVPIKNPKYNKVGHCSKCKHPVTYKSVEKFGRASTIDVMVYLIQKCETGILVREFRARSFYKKEDYKNPETLCYEERRTFFDPEWKSDAYYYGYFKQREYRWIKTNASNSLWYSEWYKGQVYRRTLPSLMKNAFSHTGLVEMIRWKKKIDPEHYLLAFRERPILEQIVKAGLYELADDLLKEQLALKSTGVSKLTKALRIDRNRLQRMRKLHGGYQHLKWFQYEKEHGMNITDDDINWFVNNQLKAKDFQFIEDRMSPRQIKNYLIRQQKQSGEPLKSILRTWEDYLSMAQRANMNVNDAIIYRTSQLYQRHNELVKIIEEMDAAIKAQEILTKYQGIDKVILEVKEKYEYRDEEYAVVAPEKVNDILYEGSVLHHCVDKGENYFDRILKKETFILFLRKREEIDKPYYTLEVEPGGTIRQIRTEYNRQNDDIKNAERFLQNWQKMVRSRMTDEDWRLADRSKKLRVQELKEMRENKVVIHGGLFSGRLLADLLEEDLREHTDILENVA